MILSNLLHIYLLFKWIFFFSLICHCLDKATANGYVAISVVYYGECYGGKDRKRIAEYIKSTENRKGSCLDNTYKKCKDTSSLDCSGDELSQFIYIVQTHHGKT